MKNKGFTLIELLAVIVILAIIALIATPIILGIINNAKEESNERSAELYKSAVELAVARQNLKGEFNPTRCTIANGVTTCEGYADPLQVDMDGELPTSGTIEFTNHTITGGNLTFNGFTATINENGKVTVKNTSSSTPTPAPVAVCTYVDSADDTGSTVGVIDTSDVVTCGTESFYVMDNNGSNVTMLSKYNLNVGDNAYTGDTLGIQSQNVGWSNSGDDYVNMYGEVPFSNELYWGAATGYVYGPQSNLAQYVTAYQTYLTGTVGVNSATATIMSFDQVVDLGCGAEDYSCSGAPSWVYSTSYWLGSVMDGEEASVDPTTGHYNTIYLITGGGWGSNPHDQAAIFGVRPVVTVSINDIQH